MVKDIKPCPHCGGVGDLVSGPEIIEVRVDRKKKQYYVSCRSCAAEGGWSWSESGAIRLWNMRQDDEKD